MKKYNIMSLISFIIVIVVILLLFILPAGFEISGCITFIVLSIISIVFGFIGKSQVKKNNQKGKVLSLLGIIFGFIIVVLSGLALFGFLALQDINYSDAYLCPNDNYVEDCIDNKDGTSTCKYMDTLELKCTTDKLKDSQLKK